MSRTNPALDLSANKCVGAEHPISGPSSRTTNNDVPAEYWNEHIDNPNSVGELTHPRRDCRHIGPTYAEPTTIATTFREEGPIRSKYRLLSRIPNTFASVRDAFVDTNANEAVWQIWASTYEKPQKSENQERH